MAIAHQYIKNFIDEKIFKMKNFHFSYPRTFSKISKNMLLEKFQKPELRQNPGKSHTCYLLASLLQGTEGGNVFLR